MSRTDTWRRRDRRRAAIDAWLATARGLALSEHAPELRPLSRMVRRHLLSGRSPPTAWILAMLPDDVVRAYLANLRRRL